MPCPQRTINEFLANQHSARYLLSISQAIFTSAQVPTVNNPRELAQRMAALARLIGEVITSAFTQEDTSGSLHQQMEGFRKVLIHELSAEQFADMDAQTIAYGLFAARVNVPNARLYSRAGSIRSA